MLKDVIKIYKSTGYAVKGLRHAYRGDKSFRMEINYGLPVYLLLTFLLMPLEPWEILIITFSYVLILLVELINTAFEKMLERVHPDQHELIGRSKDISASAVLLAFFFAFLVVTTLFFVRFTHHAPFMLGGMMV